MQQNRNIQARSTAIYNSHHTSTLKPSNMNSLKFSATGQLKGGSGSKVHHQSNEMLRNLKQELDRLKDENEELSSEMSQITQKYLTEKARAEDLVRQIGVMQRNQAGQNKTIEKIVEKRLKETQQGNMMTIEHQKLKIQKQHMYKQCLSKNVQDLQERLSALKQELRHSQKQVLAYQKMYPNEPLVLSKNASSSQGSDKIPMSSRKSNKIMHLNFDAFEPEINQNGHQKQEDVIIPDRKHHYLSKNSSNEGSIGLKNKRGKLLVAKSLAIGLGEQKYDWLFNEDETPRNPNNGNDNMDTELESARYNVQTGKKLLKNNREAVPQSDRSDQFTHASSTIKSTGIKKLKVNQFNENHQFSDEFGNTIESQRNTGDDSLLNLRKKNLPVGYDDYGAIERDSIVKKSLNGVKNILKKAADGVRSSGQAVTMAEFQSRGQNQQKFSQNALEVNHQQVEIELESPYPEESQTGPNGHPNGKQCDNWPQNDNKWLNNEFVDQNPLDDDSN